MKVIKVNKSFRSGKVEYMLVLLDDMDDDAIEEAVINVCDSDGNGMNYGYSVKWEVVTDPEIIKKAIENEIEKTKSKIDTLNNYKNNLVRNLLIINHL
jgi:hypothetical protein